MSAAVRLLSVAILTIGFSNVSHAITVTLNPTDDCYVQPSEPDEAHNGPTFIVADNTRRTGMLQFDLSSIPGQITSATLRISPAAGPAGRAVEIVGYFHLPTTSYPKIDETTLTRTTFLSDYVPFEDGPHALGTFSIVDAVENQYYDSSADDADLLILNSIRNESLADDRHFLLQLYSVTGGLAFHSKEAGLSVAPQLVIEYVPEPSAIFLLGLGTVGAGLLHWKRRK